MAFITTLDFILSHFRKSDFINRRH